MKSKVVILETKMDEIDTNMSLKDSALASFETKVDLISEN